MATQVQIPAQTGNKTRCTLNVSDVLLIEWNHIISFMSIVKSSRTSEHVKHGVAVAQWLSAVG